MSRTVWLDRGPASLLACCASCVPLWRAPAADDADGWRQLAAHIAACHPRPEKYLVHTVRRGRERVQKSVESLS